MPVLLRRPSSVFEWDTAAYLETASSIVAGRGLLERPIFGLDSTLWVPLRNWPPGYSVAVAGAHLVGAHGVWTAVAISLLASVIIVVLLSRFLQRELPRAVAIPLTLAIVWMPAFQHIGATALSDAMYFALAIASLLTLLSWSGRDDVAATRAFLAGLLAGAAWCTRYAGLALFATSALFFVGALSWRRRWDVSRGAAAWMCGAALLSVPLALRNLSTFGRINPFEAAPSTLHYGEIISANAAAAISDLTTSEWLGYALTSSVVRVVILVLLLAALLRAGRNATWQNVRAFAARHRVELLLTVYAAIHASLLVAARHHFALTDPPAGGADRHFGQIYWAVLSAAMIAFVGWLRHRMPDPAVTRSAAAVAVFLAVVQLSAIVREVTAPASPAARASLAELEGVALTRFLARDVAPDQIVVASWAYRLRIAANLNARKLVPGFQCPDEHCFSREELRRAGERGLLWGIVFDDLDGALRGLYGPLVLELLQHPERFPEFTRVPLSGPVIVFKYTGPGARSRTVNVSPAARPAS
ncbi:MAG TPA: hypothetical protein VE967_16990 [Gemmatimonadaceae bacterium]|nr:hypothetical protein [Gemmatimonadaceae bacterium]